MNNELLPCPFCGDDEIMDFQAHLENRVQCAMCNVSTDTFPSCEESHAAWNTRTKAAPVVSSLTETQDSLYYGAIDTPAEVPYALRQWAMDDEPESTLFDEGYNAARRWVRMQLEKPAEPTEKILWYTGNTADPTDAVEVVGYLNGSNLLTADAGRMFAAKYRNGFEPLMTVAQHERILADVTANRDALLLVMQGEDAIANWKQGNSIMAAKKGDVVKVPRELANRLVSTDNHVRQTARRELRNTLLGGDK